MCSKYLPVLTCEFMCIWTINFGLLYLPGTIICIECFLVTESDMLYICIYLALDMFYFLALLCINIIVPCALVLVFYYTCVCYSNIYYYIVTSCSIRLPGRLYTPGRLWKTGGCYIALVRPDQSLGSIAVCASVFRAR